MTLTEKVKRSLEERHTYKNNWKIMRCFYTHWGLWQSEVNVCEHTVKMATYVHKHSPCSDCQRSQWVLKHFIIFHMPFYVCLSSGDLFTFPVSVLHFHYYICIVPLEAHLSNNNPSSQEPIYGHAPCHI